MRSRSGAALLGDARFEPQGGGAHASAALQDGERVAEQVVRQRRDRARVGRGGEAHPRAVHRLQRGRHRLLQPRQPRPAPPDRRAHDRAARGHALHGGSVVAAPRSARIHPRAVLDRVHPRADCRLDALHAVRVCADTRPARVQYVSKQTRCEPATPRFELFAGHTCGDGLAARRRHDRLQLGLRAGMARRAERTQGGARARSGELGRARGRRACVKTASAGLVPAVRTPPVAITLIRSAPRSCWRAATRSMSATLPTSPPHWWQWPRTWGEPGRGGRGGEWQTADGRVGGAWADSGVPSG